MGSVLSEARDGTGDNTSGAVKESATANERERFILPLSRRRALIFAWSSTFWLGSVGANTPDISNS
jgi:hypothetical protein